MKDRAAKWVILIALVALIISVASMLRACNGNTEDPDPVANPSASQQATPSPSHTNPNAQEAKDVRVETIGDREYYVYKGDTFEDPGAKVYIDGTEVVDALVQVTGDVDTSNVGEYVIVYEYEGAYDTRTVYVIDRDTNSDPPITSSKPVINGKPVISQNPNVTNNPQVTDEPTASESVAVSPEPTATTKAEKFTVKLKGNAIMEVEEGSEFLDPGVKVYDQDGKLRTDVKVTVKGRVDTSKVGTYTLIYSVEGFSINRIVRVVPKRVVVTDPPPEVSKDPPPEVSKDPPPEVSKDPPPEVSKDPPPEVSKDPPPEVSKDPPPEVSKDPPPEVSKDPPPPQPSDTEIEDNPAASQEPPPPQPSDTEIEDNPATSQEPPPPQPSDTEIEDNPAASQDPPPQPSDTQIEDNPAASQDPPAQPSDTEFEDNPETSQRLLYLPTSDIQLRDNPYDPKVRTIRRRRVYRKTA